MQTSQESRIAVSVRSETPEDFAEIRRINADAFGRCVEANLVDVLRRHRQLSVSLVAEVEKELVGYIALTQVILMPTVPGLRMLGLGPIAVLPELQRQGIGSLLIHEAIGVACNEGCHGLVALGAPDYYARFGFIPARRAGLETEFRVSQGAAFMFLELQRGTMEGLHGVVRYQPEFSGF